ncbi:MAG: 50S ribosomal protein L24 [Candidatus Woesebacteria bacterium GW2011_GWC1_30_29]|uniref:Large ribosomal subunit protein uL24 n=1 Tax=Candidatus Woesebacteria bacterium GW2011_GWC2_31_9 TaxID=1618586 RepID=A0A0G0BM58_9BACT|nr:MAG: 50S ribosomal protein L24 [Candidatus Woesebacteria bacterium GW2011_GWC1_30_29]KKP26158.1 MAG: 50S ribosomal protein L24 [Candidatus Woesebacteria bacterium GW2011_GWD1_31_12]KKP27585.1 MAG: 50S ribosomal protein L24 [Candidatus Woesebacteria bacterium GW2011_GWB1_31_29]KKP32102.1 MAG: 50S ribosomal protein L24 [Candidatus Woesebacteria bacterium GW2011_GWC2_31_9]KKP34358.1 MAG: 50S ribosomal protein L24 [Candidatus Woesebacteria bacterium GW2011_GWF2_32_16]KKP62461.1 MAG: 50S ribosom
MHHYQGRLFKKNNMKLKVGDTVKITAGKDKGREGKIEKISPKENTVVVPGVNIYKKHIKGSQGQKGGVYDIPRPLNLAKIALICPLCKKVTRVGVRLVKNEKVRICKKCKKEI